MPDPPLVRQGILHQRQSTQTHQPMKTNTIIILLGVAIACQAQTTNPPANQKPVRPRDAFIAESKDPFASSGVTVVKSKDGNAFIADPEDASIPAGPPPQSFDPFAAKSADGGNVRVLNRDAAVELSLDLANKGRFAEARALLNEGASNGNVRFVRRQDGSVFIEDAPKEKQTSNPPKPADDAMLSLVSPKDADPGASQRLTLTTDPTVVGMAPAKVSKDGHASDALVTRLYPLKGLITKSPAEVDDDAHNKKADDAYKAKVEALLGWVKMMLEHSEPADASFAFSPEAGAIVVKATDAQHEALTQGAAIFEENYGK